MKKTITINSHREETIKEVRETSQKITKIPISQQRLTTQGKNLNEEKTTMSNNIKDERTIGMTLRLQGGMKTMHYLHLQML